MTPDNQLLRLTYRVQLSERAVLMQLNQMDTNGDGTISDGERDAFFSAQALMIAGLFTLEVDGQSLKFTPDSLVQRDARLGQTFTFATKLNPLSPGRHPGRLIDGYSREYPGPYRWLGTNDWNPRSNHIEPLVPAANAPGSEHPAYLELKFAVVAPE